MKAKDILAVFLLLLGIYFLSRVFTNSSAPAVPMYIVPAGAAVVAVAVIVSRLRHRIDRFIVKSSIDSSMYSIVLEDGEYYFVGFKVVGKEISAEEQKAYNNVGEIYIKELESAVESIQRAKNRYLKVAIVTLLDPVPGTAVLFYIKKDDKMSKEYLLNEAMILKSTVEGVAPHILLEPISLKTSPVLPFPGSVGAVAYPGYIALKKFEVKSELTTVESFDIPLGKTIGIHEVPVGINSNDVFRHVAIFGATGGGKSFTSTLIAKELAKKGFDVVILDWHGEYHERIPEFNYYGEKNPLVINPLSIENQESIVDIVEMLGDVLDISDAGKFRLYLALLRVPEFDLKELLKAIDEVLPNTQSQTDSKIALTRKLIMMFAGKGSELFSPKGLSYKELAEKLRGGNIIDLSFIRNTSLRRIYSMIIVKFLLEYFRETRNKTRKMYVVLEEAQNYFYLKENNKGNVVLTSALQEIRKFNVGLCIITQSPSNVDPEVLKNTNIRIIHAIKSSIDKDIIAKTLSLSDQEIAMMDKLGQGEAIVTAPNIRKPVVIKVANPSIPQSSS